MENFRPMLAVDCSDNLNYLPYPVLGSWKIDGIRSCVLEPLSCPLTRSLKAIPNNHIRETIRKELCVGHLDFEICAVNEEGKDLPFNETSSAVMSEGGTPKFVCHVFEKIWENVPAYLRYQELCNLASQHLLPPFFKVLPQYTLKNSKEVIALAEAAVVHGYEGIMLKGSNTNYKFGRSTLPQAALLKLKRWIDGEAVIIGFTELMHNFNSATSNALGLTERSSFKSGLVPAGQLGNFIVQLEPSKVTFEIGTGFTQAQRLEYWKRRGELIGRIVKYKSQDFGVVERPRTPVFLGFRDERDMG